MNQRKSVEKAVGKTGRKRGGAGKPPPRPPQQARSRATRRRVLDAAIDCFEEHGFEETTTAMIARRAGVAVGSVYNHFVDKRALILELLAETDREHAEPVVAGLDPAGWRGRTDPREITRSLIDAVFQGQGRRPGLQRILWARYFKDPEFEVPFEAVRERIRRAIVEFIDAVDEQGLLRPGLDREMAPFVVLNAVQWNATQAYFRGRPRFLDDAAEATAEMVALYLFRDGGLRGRRPARVRTSRPD